MIFLNAVINVEINKNQLTYQNLHLVLLQVVYTQVIYITTFLFSKRQPLFRLVLGLSCAKI